MQANYLRPLDMTSRHLNELGILPQFVASDAYGICGIFFSLCKKKIKVKTNILTCAKKCAQKTCTFHE